MADDQGFYPISGGVWRACAGRLIHLPQLNSRVYYFANGHAEQASSKVNFPSSVNSTPAILCRLTNITFLADPRTEEVLVKFALQPLTFDEATATTSTDTDDSEGSPNPNPGFVSYNKILTVSDANNGGGFSVPRYCAESIFPLLNFKEDPPVMNIHIADAKGHKWEFRHIYRGTPRRHLLTTGWSKYVNAKYLIAGDTVVFIRNILTEELFVGLRRSLMGCSYSEQFAAEQEPLPEPEEGFSREKKGRVPPMAVVDAAHKALNGIPFEAVYYPRPGMPEFVVAADKVVASCGMYWTPGTRVKISLETDDGLRETWHNGSVASVAPADNRSWPGSSWRMLEVSWDEESEGLKAMQKVSPWQLKLLGPTPPIHDAFPPLKKYKGVPNSGLPTDTQGDIPLPTMEFHSMMDNLNPPFASYNTIVDGISIQGTRHFLSLFPSIPNFPKPVEGIEGVTNPDHHDDELNNPATHLSIVSSPSDTPSAGSQNTVLSIDKAAPKQNNVLSVDKTAPKQNTVLSVDQTAPKQHTSNLVTGKVPVSFQLFGHMIHTVK